MDRGEINRLVYRRLADPDFRRRLTATAPDGTKPVIVALREDLVRELLAQLEVAGGAGNVVLPLLNGIVVIAMEQEESGSRRRGEPAIETINGDCTVGVLMERLTMDLGMHGGEQMTYRFMVRRANHSDARTRAGLVALAG